MSLYYSFQCPTTGYPVNVQFCEFAQRWVAFPEDGESLPPVDAKTQEWCKVMETSLVGFTEDDDSFVYAIVARYL